MTPSSPMRGDALPLVGWWRRLRYGYRLVHAAPDWLVFAGENWLEQIMQAQVTDRYHAKQGRSIGRWVLESNGQQLSVYLKRHYRLPWLAGVLAVVFPRRAWSPGLAEYQHLCWAARAGFPVPRPVAAGQILQPGARLQSFLAVQELTGMLPLHEALPRAQQQQAPANFLHWKRGLIREMARLTGELHSRFVFHKDLYLCHFYIPEKWTCQRPDDWRGEVFLIDLHRLRRHRLTWPWWLVKDLAQLLYSSDVEGVTTRDRLLFWRVYRKAWPGGRPPRNWFRWVIGWKWRLYERHNRRSPQVPEPGGSD